MSQRINQKKPQNTLEKLQQDKFSLEQKVKELQKEMENGQKQGNHSLEVTKLRRENARLKSDLTKLEQENKNKSSTSR